MRHITTAIKSSRLATLIAIGLAGLYAATEFGEHPAQQAGAVIPTKTQITTIQGAVDPLKLAALTIPVPSIRPQDLPVVQQPFQVDVVSLTQKWSTLSFDLDQIRKGGEVPRYFVAQIPVDILDIDQVQSRKRVFLSLALPLILRANEEIQARRNRLQKLLSLSKQGTEISPNDREWVSQLTELYNAKPGDLADLYNRVDVIPVSLALAQSIEESGWGTSRFAREGNALFGQRVWSPGNGIVPHEREEGTQYEVKVYDELYHSIKSYVHNLNSHDAYSDFRQHRYNLKRDYGVASGYALTRTLLSYSERGEAYVDALKALIRVNRLGQFEHSRLVPEQVAQVLRSASN